MATTVIMGAVADAEIFYRLKTYIGLEVCLTSNNMHFRECLSFQ